MSYYILSQDEHDYWMNKDFTYMLNDITKTLLLKECNVYYSIVWLSKAIKKEGYND